jgi:hypothetical protein
MNRRQRKKRAAQHARTREVFFSMLAARALGFAPKPQRLKLLDPALREVFA